MEVYYKAKQNAMALYRTASIGKIGWHDGASNLGSSPSTSARFYMRRYNDYKLTKSGKKSRSKRDLTPEQLKNVEWLKYKIIVPTEDEKQELIEVFKHFHYSDIDTEYVGVNQLAHEYLEGNSIIVDKELYEKLNK